MRRLLSGCALVSAMLVIGGCGGSDNKNIDGSALLLKVGGLSSQSQVVLGNTRQISVQVDSTTVETETLKTPTKTTINEQARFGATFQNGQLNSNITGLTLTELLGVPAFEQGTPEYSAFYLNPRIEYLNNGFQDINFSLNTDVLKYGFEFQVRSKAANNAAPTVYWNSTEALDWCASLDRNNFRETFVDVQTELPNTLGPALTWSSLFHPVSRTCVLPDLALQFIGRDFNAVKAKVAEQFGSKDHSDLSGVQKPRLTQVIDAVLLEVPVVSELTAANSELELVVKVSINEFAQSQELIVPVTVNAVQLSSLPRN